jgi:hypothetical protein
MAKQAARKIETVTEAPEAEEAKEVAEETAERELSPAEMLRAQNDAEKALKALQRDSGGDSTLSKYFREMAGHRVLTPAEEVSAAVEVERLEIGYWEALLAYAPVLDTVATVLERLLEEPQPTEIAALRRLAKNAKAGKLSKNDTGSCRPC